MSNPRKIRELVQKLDQSIKKSSGHFVLKSDRLSKKTAMEFIQKAADELGKEQPGLSAQQRFARTLDAFPTLGGLACDYSWEQVTGDYSGL